MGSISNSPLDTECNKSAVLPYTPRMFLSTTANRYVRFSRILLIVKDPIPHKGLTNNSKSICMPVDLSSVHTGQDYANNSTIVAAN